MGSLMNQHFNQAIGGGEGGGSPRFKASRAFLTGIIMIKTYL